MVEENHILSLSPLGIDFVQTEVMRKQNLNNKTPRFLRKLFTNRVSQFLTQN